MSNTGNPELDNVLDKMAEDNATWRFALERAVLFARDYVDPSNVVQDLLKMAVRVGRRGGLPIETLKLMLEEVGRES